jgi:hypothetical protein
MSPNQQIALIAAAVLLASVNGAQAGTVTETTTAPIVFSGPDSETFSFPPIANANELVSISGGSLSTGEGGTVDIILDYTNGTTRTLFEHTGAFETIDLSSISDIPFPQGSIHGITFTAGEALGLPSGVTVPEGTEFVFRTGVPEPMTWAMLIVGIGLLGLRLRMSAGRQAAASA